MFYKFLIIMTIISLSSCSDNYLDFIIDSDPIIDLSYLAAKETLTFGEKGLYYPSWNISLRALENQSRNRIFTAEQKEITLRIMSIIRFVLNTPEYEANILKQTMKASRSAAGKTTSERVYIGKRLDSGRVLRTAQKTMLETEIALADLDSNILGVGIATNIYLYLEDMNHRDYPYIMRQLNNLVWIQFSSSHYVITDNLDTYANLGNTILHEAVHNLGFFHHDSIPTSVDVAYVMGDTYETTLRHPDFLNKYADKFKKIIPYFEEKYSSFIRTEPALRARNAENKTFYAKTHSSNGEPLTVIECIIENSEDYVKPFRYAVKDGQRTIDNFILK